MCPEVTDCEVERGLTWGRKEGKEAHLKSPVIQLVRDNGGVNELGGIEDGEK